MGEIYRGEEAIKTLKEMLEKYWIMSVKDFWKNNSIDDLKMFLQKNNRDEELVYLKSAYENNKLKYDQLVWVLRYISIDIKTIQENFPEIDSKELLKPEEVLKRYLKGEIDEDYFNSRREINKKNRDSILQALDEETITDLMKTDKKLKGLKPTEEELIEFYINGKISGKTLIELANGDRIRPQLLLEIFERDKNGKEVSGTDTDESINKLKIEQLLDFYDAKVLLNLLESEKINEKFVENFSSNINTQSENEEQNKVVEEYFKKLVQDIQANRQINQNKEQEENSASYETIQLYLKGIIPAQYVQDLNFDENDIFDTYYKGEFTDEDIFKMFNAGLISREMVQIIMPDQETITQKVIDGTLNHKAIPLLDKSQIPELIKNGTINSGLIIKSYLDDNGIEIKDVIDIFKDIQLMGIDFSEFIHQGASVEKIKQLYINSIIPQTVIKNMLERKVISDVQYEEIITAKDENQLYEKLFGNTQGIYVAEQTRGKVGYRKKNNRGKEVKKDRQFDTEYVEELLKNLGVDERIIDIRGRKNSLAGYKIRGFKNFGLVLFEKFEKRGNAIYIMTVSDAEYILNQAGKTGVISIDGANITKSGIVSSPFTRKINACPNMGRNILNAMKHIITENNDRNRSGQKDRLEEFTRLQEDVVIKTIIEIIKETYDKGETK